MDPPHSVRLTEYNTYIFPTIKRPTQIHFAIETNNKYIFMLKPEQTPQPKLRLTGSYQTLWSLSNYPPHFHLLHSLQGMKIFPKILSDQRAEHIREISQRCIINPGWGLWGNPPGFGWDSPGWTIWHQVAGLEANFTFLLSSSFSSLDKELL